MGWLAFYLRTPAMRVVYAAGVCHIAILRGGPVAAAATVARSIICAALFFTGGCLDAPGDDDGYLDVELISVHVPNAGLAAMAAAANGP